MIYNPDAHNIMCSPFFIFDVDGTLANAAHRVHLIQGEKKDWDGFFAMAKDDEPIKAVTSVMHALMESSYRILFVTGRCNSQRLETARWMERSIGITEGVALRRLVMRPEGDRRHDYEVKGEWWDTLHPFYKNNCMGVFEDRSQVVKMWREKGLVAFQVADGNF